MLLEELFFALSRTIPVSGISIVIPHCERRKTSNAIFTLLLPNRNQFTYCAFYRVREFR